MAKAAILYVNLAAGLTPTGTSSSTVAGLGWDMLNDPQPRKRARVAATSAILVFDLGSAQSVDCAALISTNLPASVEARLRASTADPTVTSSLLLDTGLTSEVTSPAYNGNIIACFSSVSARYWRWDISDADTSVDIGLAPLGLLFSPAINFAVGAQEGVLDFSSRDQNPHTGAAFGLAGAKLHTRLITFPALTKAELRDTFGALDRLVGASGDVLFVEDSDASWIDRARDSIWGNYRQAGPDLATQIEIDRWSRSMRLMERL